MTYPAMTDGPTIDRSYFMSPIERRTLWQLLGTYMNRCQNLESEVRDLKRDLLARVEVLEWQQKLQQA